MSYPSKRSAAFLELLQRRLVILDGAMGTMIQRRINWRRDQQSSLEALSLTHPHIISDIHRRYLAAGADVISTNTFDATAVLQIDPGLAARAAEMHEASARLARTVADEVAATTGTARFVAGVMGPTRFSLSRASSGRHAQTRSLNTETLTAAYAQACIGLIRGGVDVLLIETVVDIDNARAAVAAARTVMDDYGVQLPLIVSTVLDDAGHTLSGRTPENFWHVIRDARPAIVGFNCVVPGPQLRQPLTDLARVVDCGVCLYPSAGQPDAAGHYAQTPASIAELLSGLARAGLLNMLGGCCGTTPDHIRALAAAVAGIPPRAYQGAGL